MGFFHERDEVRIIRFSLSSLHYRMWLWELIDKSYYF
jgi:hypothetical protein